MNKELLQRIFDYIDWRVSVGQHAWSEAAQENAGRAKVDMLDLCEKSDLLPEKELKEIESRLFGIINSDERSTEIPVIVSEPGANGCSSMAETIGYFAGEISRLRSENKRLKTRPPVAFITDPAELQGTFLQNLMAEIDRLAKVLLDEFGGPTHNEGAVDTAIRKLRDIKTDNDLYVKRVENILDAARPLREDADLGLTIGDDVVVGGIKALIERRDYWRELARTACADLRLHKGPAVGGWRTRAEQAEKNNVRLLSDLSAAEESRNMWKEQVENYKSLLNQVQGLAREKTDKLRASLAKCLDCLRRWRGSPATDEAIERAEKVLEETK